MPPGRPVKKRIGKVEEDGSFRTVGGFVWDPDTGKYRKVQKTPRKKK